MGEIVIESVEDIGGTLIESRGQGRGGSDRVRRSVVERKEHLFKPSEPLPQLFVLPLQRV